jgi:hypothetical protein
MVAETLNECANVQSIKERPGERRLNDEKKKTSSQPKERSNRALACP